MWWYSPAAGISTIDWNQVWCICNIGLLPRPNSFNCSTVVNIRVLKLETFRNVTLTVTVTVRGARLLWRHRIVCIWNAPNRRPNRKCQHMTVSAADNRMRFTVSGYAKFHQIFRENDIDLLYFNKQLSKCSAWNNQSPTRPIRLDFGLS